MSRLLKDSAVVSAAEVVGAVVMLLNSVIIARATGADGKGTYTLAVTLAALTSLTMGLRWDRATGHFLARDEQRLAAIIGSCLFMGLLATVLSLIAWRVYPPVFEQVIMRGVGRRIVILALFMTFPHFLGLAISAIYGGLRKFATRSLFLVSLGLVQVAPIAILALLGISDVFHYLSAQFAALLVFKLAWLGVLMYRQRVRPRIERRLMSQMARYSSYAYVALLLDTLTVRLDVFLVNRLIQPAEVAVVQLGIYSVAVGLALQLGRIPNILGHVVFNRASANEIGEGQTTACLVRLALLAMLAGGAVLAALGSFVIVSLYGADFAPAAGPLYVMIPAIMFLGSFRLLASDLDGRGKPGRVSLCSLLAAIVIVALDFWWIPRFGIMGAAWASLVAYGVAFAAGAGMFCRVTGIGAWAAYRPRLSDIIMLIDALRELLKRVTGRQPADRAVGSKE